jgi:hypothetical protein
MANKLTEREIYTMMINGTIDGDVMAEFAEKKLAQLDKRNASAQKRAAAKREATDVLTEQVMEYISENPQTREDITEAMIADGHEVTVGKVTSRLSKLVKAERIAKAKAKVSGEDGKSREVTVYALSF